MEFLNSLKLCLLSAIKHAKKKLIYMYINNEGNNKLYLILDKYDYN